MNAELLARAFLVIAIALQLGAAILAFRLIRTTGRKLAWVLISCALLLMIFRRALPLYYTLSGRPLYVDPLNECIGMVLSGLMLAGVGFIGPIFDRIFESERELAESERRFRSYFELPIVGIAVLTPDFRWLTVNDRVCDIFGRGRDELLGRPISEAAWPEDAEREAALATKAFEGGGNSYSLDKRILRKDQAEPVWVNQAVRCVRGPGAEVSYFVTIIQDISDRKRYEDGLRGSMREKEVLLKELYHRTKNNMQIICSLLNLMGSNAGDERLIGEFRIVEDRIKSMSLVHEKLYQSANLSSIDLADYVHDLAELLMSGYSAAQRGIELKLELSSSTISIEQAIPFGLIMNELVTNSLIHAFPAGRGGSIAIALSRSERGEVRLIVSDDGVGIESLEELSETRGIGIRTAQALAVQLGGTLSYDSGSGTTWLLTFYCPISEKAEDLSRKTA
jgi:PAS domain S-box